MSQVSGSFQQTGYSRRTLPILSIKFTVQKSSGKDVEFNDEFWVDSAFTGDLKMPQSFGSRLKGMGITAIKELVQVASGNTISENLPATIQAILLNGVNLLPTPKPCLIACMGENRTAKLVGLNALNQWTVCLDMPNEVLTIS